MLVPSPYDLVELQIKESPRPRIIATDYSEKAIENARKNAIAAGVAGMIEFSVCDFAATEIPQDQPGVLMLNPEYGERLGNIAELELITGWFSKFNSIEDRIKLIQDRFKINTVIVTMGGDGAIINDKGVVYRHPGLKVVVADTIGSGDSFLAGFLNQLLNGAMIKEALDFASAVGAFIATKPGACPEYDAREVMGLSHQM